MKGQLEIEELWSLRITPSDLYNIERWPSDKPVSGGGHLYIQVPRSLVDSLLRFLRESAPRAGKPLLLDIHDRERPELPVERLEFWAKSMGRMRIARQNRHRAKNIRPRAWMPERGFPSLEEFQNTTDATHLLNKIGGLHIYFARVSDGTVWADFTTGAPSKGDAQLPFADLLWGEGAGGYWRYED